MVYTTELPFEGDVRLNPQGFITSILSLGVPAGAYVVSGVVALHNREDVAVDVDISGNSNPPPLSFAGPRSGQIHLPPGASGSVTLGPFVAEVGLAGVVALLIGQVTPHPASGPGVWATEGTTLANRAGATGLTFLGTGAGALDE